MSFITKPSFCMLISGRQGDGKTHLVKYIVHEICAKYNSIICFCPTANMSESNYDYLPKKFVHTMYDKQILQNYVELHTEHRNLRGLVIMDDIMGSVNLNDKMFLGMFSNMRHLHIDVIILENYMKYMPKALRSMCTYVIQFRLTDERNAEALREEFGDGYNRANRDEFYQLVMGLPRYVFLLITTYEYEPEKRFRKLKAPAEIPSFKLDYGSKKKQVKDPHSQV